MTELHRDLYTARTRRSLRLFQRETRTSTILIKALHSDWIFYLTWGAKKNDPTDSVSLRSHKIWNCFNYIVLKNLKKKQNSESSSMFQNVLGIFNFVLHVLWHQSWNVSVWRSFMVTRMISRLIVNERCFNIIIIEVNFLFPSGLRCQCSAGPDSGSKEHLHRDAILDGSWGHRLWWKPRCYLRLQGKDLQLN